MIIIIIIFWGGLRMNSGLDSIQLRRSTRIYRNISYRVSVRKLNWVPIDLIKLACACDRACGYAELFKNKKNSSISELLCEISSCLLYNAVFLKKKITIQSGRHLFWKRGFGFELDFIPIIISFYYYFFFKLYNKQIIWVCVIFSPPPPLPSSQSP